MSVLEFIGILAILGAAVWLMFPFVYLWWYTFLMSNFSIVVPFRSSFSLDRPNRPILIRAFLGIVLIGIVLVLV